MALPEETVEIRKEITTLFFLCLLNPGDSLWNSLFGLLLNHKHTLTPMGTQRDYTQTWAMIFGPLMAHV